MLATMVVEVFLVVRFPLEGMRIFMVEWVLFRVMVIFAAIALYSWWRGCSWRPSLSA